MVFKCKMCGGDITFNQGETYGQCDHCGRTSTIPKVNEEQNLNRYNRANHFRRQGEYDKAILIYEKILEDDNSDAEAHWGIVLSRYGIEYVEDPKTKKRIPTCNRMQKESVLSDYDYHLALQYAQDQECRNLYEQQAKEIAEIQRGILDISQREAPFDVFICYKESDERGKRTRDSVLANDLYYQLTKEGFRVFYSRITLEDKIGTAYEPYIFAALNSAKVMIVVGTKPEYFNAVWVKNEWSRYLAIIKADAGNKLLIPAYRDMDPYDLPDEFSHLQALDMSKLGFMQDIIHGIKKIINSEKQPEINRNKSGNTNGNTDLAVLIKRVFIFLEDGDFNSANNYCEKVLDRDPENVQAYLGKLMAEAGISRREDLMFADISIFETSAYKRILVYGDDNLVKFLKECRQEAEQRAIKNSLEYKNRQKNLKDRISVISGEIASLQNERNAKDICLGEHIRHGRWLMTSPDDFKLKYFLLAFIMLCCFAFLGIILYPYGKGAAFVASWFVSMVIFFFICSCFKNRDKKALTQAISAIDTKLNDLYTEYNILVNSPLLNDQDMSNNTVYNQNTGKSYILNAKIKS